MSNAQWYDSSGNQVLSGTLVGGGGGSQPYVWRLSLFTNNLPSSPTLIFVLTEDPESNILVASATSLPISVGAGGHITTGPGQRAYLPDQLPSGGLLVAENIEVAVSNADATEVLVASNADPLPPLTPDENDFTDLGSTSHTGSDLSVSGVNIVSAAGGVFTAFQLAGGRADYVSAHPYGDPLDPNTGWDNPWKVWPQIKALAKKNLGDPSKVMATEGGYDLTHGTGYANSSVANGMDARASMDFAAFLAFTMMPDAMAPNYTPGGQGDFGLVDASLAKRPAFASFKARAL